MKSTHPLIIALFAALLMVGCNAGANEPSEIATAARAVMSADGFADAEITSIVEGDAAVRGADELYCIATEATTQNGELPYLVVVWRTGDTWDGAQLLEGYYDWDLQGCPR